MDAPARTTAQGEGGSATPKRRRTVSGRQARREAREAWTALVPPALMPTVYAPSGSAPEAEAPEADACENVAARRV
jgi:hypothetical protein